MKHLPKLMLALEQELVLKDRPKTLVERATFAVAGIMGIGLPDLTFDDEDVNMDIVKRILAHPKEMDIVDEWIMEGDPAIMDRLRHAQKVFAGIMRPPATPKLFRGFKMNSNIQNTMGLKFEKGFFSDTAKFKVGEEFEVPLDRPISFTHHHPQAKIFGGIIVEIDTAANRADMLHISNEYIYASTNNRDGTKAKRMAKYYVSYGEALLVPPVKPRMLKFKVHQIGK